MPHVTHLEKPSLTATERGKAQSLSEFFSQPFWKQPGILRHISELKKRVKLIAIAYFANLIFWLLLPAAAFDPSALFTGLYKPMIALVLNNALSLAGGRITLISGTLTAPLEIYFLAGAVMALVTSSPIIGYEIFKFVDPALYPKEKKLLGRFMVGFVGLLVGGAAVGYFLLTPAIIRFMTYFAHVFGIESVITAGDYYGMVLITVAATAISFTTPAVFLLLVEFGILSSRALTKNRLIIYLGLYVVIAAITPEPVVGHFGMFFPLVIMLEISAVLAKRIEKRRGTPALFGAAEEKVKKCRYCGTTLEDDVRFCPSCGKSQS